MTNIHGSHHKYMLQEEKIKDENGFLFEIPKDIKNYLKSWGIKIFRTNLFDDFRLFSSRADV